MRERDEPHLFWQINEETGKLSPQIVDTFLFLQQRGFTRRKMVDQVELFRQTEHIVEEVYSNDQIEALIDFLKNEHKRNITLTVNFPRKGDVTYTYTPKQVLENFTKYGWGKIMNDKNFMNLPELKVNIKRHTRDKAFFYFKNGYVEITRKGTQFFSYTSIGNQCIFKDHLIDRDIQLWDINEETNQDFAPKGYQFLDFLNRLAGVPLEDKKAIDKNHADKLAYLLQSIGFLLHDYRQQGLTDFCVIVCDDNVGGSGKGILVQALRQMTKVTETDGKKDERFDPDDLNERTRVKVVNDIPNSFAFTNVYNEVTDQAQIRHMHKAPRGVPYAEAWKVLITSNHVVRGNTGADLRRQRVFSVETFFNQKHTPRDQYGHSFFSSDWGEHDWNFFYNTMFECVRQWLDTDYKLNYYDADYAQLKMEEEYPSELREFIENILEAVRHNGTQTHKISDLYYQFKINDKYSQSPGVRKMSIKLFSKLIRDYLVEMKIPHDRSTNRSEIWISRKTE